MIGTSRNIKLCGILLIFIFVISILGCGDQKSKVIGKWKPVEVAEYTWGGKKKITKNPQSAREFEFFQDNTVLMSQLGSGKWILLDDGRIKIDLGMMGMGMVMFGSLQDGTLTITWPGEKGYMKLKKVNYNGSNMDFKEEVVSTEKDQSEKNGFESKEFSNRASPQDLRLEVEKISEKIRSAHLNKDINKWLSCYNSSYPNLGRLENNQLELWKNYDIKEVNYRISNVQRVSDSRASADIVWNIQLYDHRTHDYTLVRQSYITFLEKGQGGWKIRDSKEYAGGTH